MKIFLQRELRLAYAHAMAGGQALHVCERRGLVGAGAPDCFQRSEQFAHLFDQNYDRLIGTVKRVGVRVVRPQHCGTYRQHVDLCGKPMERAIKWAERWAEREKRERQQREAEAAQVLLPLDVSQLSTLSSQLSSG